MAFAFGLWTLKLKEDARKIYRFKGMKPKNKGHMKFLDCCDLTKKVYLMLDALDVHTYSDFGGRSCVLSHCMLHS